MKEDRVMGTPKIKLTDYRRTWKIHDKSTNSQRRSQETLFHENKERHVHKGDGQQKGLLQKTNRKLGKISLN